MYNKVTEERSLLRNKESYKGIFSCTFFAMEERINLLVKLKKAIAQINGISFDVKRKK
jgi:hypothetical protein